MRHHFQKRQATVADSAKLVFFCRRSIMCHHQITFAFDLEALFEVSLIRQHLFKPANIAECYWSSILTNGEMMLRFAWLHARPAAAHKTRLNSPDFEFTETDWALLGAAHGANDELY